METTTPATAIILAGAVAKGAFQAGVLSVLERANLRIVRIVATSAGALNGAVFATGIRHGRTALAVELLTRHWRRDAHWGNLLRPSLSCSGLSSGITVRALLRDAMNRLAAAARPPGVTPSDITLQMVTAPLRGKANERGPRAAIEGATTFEHVMEFAGPSFDDPAAREQVILGAAASAAFPLLFAPIPIEPVGPCVDGGAVNNTPVSYALESPDVGRVIVVTDNPLLRGSHPAELRGLALFGRLADILINERLFRDLIQAHRDNTKLAQLSALADKWGLSPDQRAELMSTLGWRPVELVQIRPAQPLEGTPFSALRDRRKRERYIDQGRQAAEEALRTMT